MKLRHLRYCKAVKEDLQYIKEWCPVWIVQRCMDLIPNARTNFAHCPSVLDLYLLIEKAAY